MSQNTAFHTACEMAASGDLALNVPLLSQGYSGALENVDEAAVAEPVEVSSLVGGKLSVLVNILQGNGVVKLGAMTANVRLLLCFYCQIKDWDAWFCSAQLCDREVIAKSANQTNLCAHHRRH